MQSQGDVLPEELAEPANFVTQEKPEKVLEHEEVEVGLEKGDYLLKQLPESEPKLGDIEMSVETSAAEGPISSDDELEDHKFEPFYDYVDREIAKASVEENVEGEEDESIKNIKTVPDLIRKITSKNIYSSFDLIVILIVV